MAKVTYIEVDHEIIPSGSDPVVDAQNIQCVDERLDEVLREIGNSLETLEGLESANETNIATNTSAISGLDSRVTILEEQGSGGTSDYTALTNKPKINGNELTGNKTSSQLGLASESDILDNGACKNIVNLRSPTTVKNTTVVFDATGSATFKSGGTWTQYIVDFPTVINKDYKLYLNVESTNTTSGAIFLRTPDNSKNYYNTTINSTGEKTKVFTAITSTTRICIYSNNSATSRTDSVKLKVMVCDANLSDTSFKQYIPSNEDLYLMILGLK